MSAADDGGNAGRRLAGWFGRRSGQLVGAIGRPADETSAHGAVAVIEAIIAGLPDPVIMLDRDGRAVAFNAGAGALAPALRRGDPASIALRVPELVEAVREVNAGGGVRRIEFAERVPTERHFEAFVSPVVLGNLQAVLIALHDLTSIRRVEEMRADFVANASHELRTPLAALTGFIETMQGPARDDAAARDRFLGIMREQAWRMARLIDDLLSLSRIELRAHMRPDTPVDLVPIVRQVVDGLQTLARGPRRYGRCGSAGGAAEGARRPRRAAAPVRKPDRERPQVWRQRQACRHHVGVASMPADGKREASIAVRDYGPGISAEHLPRLTERFYRADVSESRAQGGTGLGLALVKHILNRHRGRLAIESQLGKGATFTARLPIH